MAALTVLTVPALGPTGVADRSSASAAAPSADALAVTVRRIDPWTPTTSETKRPLRFAVTLRNDSDTALSDVGLRLSRRVQPVYDSSELQSVVGTRTMPTDVADIASTGLPRTVDIPAGGSSTIRLTTFSGVPNSYPLCLCANAVYPLYISAYDVHSGDLEGFGTTFVASVDNAPDSKGNPFAKVGVAWVWPLIDRPHRTTESTVFTDDSLFQSVVSGGRLDRALQVVKDVGSSTPMTLMVDPDLIDELAVMSKGYTYRTPAGQTVAGQGGPAASAWLTGLRQVLTDDSQFISLQFTPYADPAVQSLSGAGLNWRQLPPTMRRRVQTALGLQTLSDTLAWPPGGRAGTTALSRIAATGSTSVLLDNASVRPRTVHGLPATSATLATDHGALSAGLLSDEMQRDVATTMSSPTSNLSRLPHLLAQLALLPDHEPYESRVAFLAAPRYVNPSPAVAETVIRATTRSAFSTPMPVVNALAQGARTAASHSRTRHLSESASPWSLTTAQLSYAGQTAHALSTASDVFGGANATSATLAALAQFPRALQRSESAAWTRASSLGSPAQGEALTRRVRSQVTGLARSVQIVRPPSGGYSYSLASNSSPLPVTVVNNSPYRASINIDLVPADGLPGVSSNRLVDKTVAPQSKQTFRIQTRVQRSGRIELLAVLSTPNGRQILGPRVRLSVHSTVFGTVGLVITVVAAAVLLLALGLRYFRRVQRLRRKRVDSAVHSKAASPPTARAGR